MGSIATIQDALRVFKKNTALLDKAGDTLGGHVREDQQFSFLDIGFLANAVSTNKFGLYDPELKKAAQYVMSNKGQFYDYFDPASKIFNISELANLDLAKPKTTTGTNVPNPGVNASAEQQSRLILNSFSKIDTDNDGKIKKEELEAAQNNTSIGEFTRGVIKNLVGDSIRLNQFDKQDGDEDGSITRAGLGGLLGINDAKPKEPKPSDPNPSDPGPKPLSADYIRQADIESKFGSFSGLVNAVSGGGGSFTRTALKAALDKETDPDKKAILQNISDKYTNIVQNQTNKNPNGPLTAELLDKWYN